MAEARTASAPKKTRRPRGSISADDIVAAAFEVAEKVTLAKLSMPMLARHLDVGVTSIYWYFRRKEELLDAMTQRASDEYHFVTPFVEGADWKSSLRNHFHKMRETFRAHPVLVELILLRARAVSPAALAATGEKFEAMVQTMAEAGFDQDDALTVYMSLSEHSSGAAIGQYLRTVQRDAEGVDAPTDIVSTPVAQRLAEAGRSTHGIEDAVFEYTLEAILDRAESLIRTGAKSGR